jgi:hypothetical protein
MISRLTNTNIVDVVMVTVTEMTWRTGASYEEIYNIRNKITYNIINNYFNRSMKSGSHLSVNPGHMFIPVSNQNWTFNVMCYGNCYVQ